jgi:hypothetical protein
MAHARTCPPAEITFGEMRSTGVRGILIYCSDCVALFAITQSDRACMGISLMIGSPYHADFR